MSDYYTKSGAPATSSSGSSATMRAEFALIETGFTKLPSITGNGGKFVRVNSGATALEAVTAATARTGLGVGSGDTPTFTGSTLTGTTATDLSDNGNPFNVGTLAGAHLAGDKDSIQAKGSATTSATLKLNPLGGTVQAPDGGDTLRQVGFNVMPITSVAIATTLSAANQGHQIRFTTASIDADITTATTDSADDGAVWVIVNESAGNITIDGNVGITLTWLDGAGGTTGDRTLADGGYATIIKRADTQYQVTGIGLS